VIASAITNLSRMKAGVYLSLVQAAIYVLLIILLLAFYVFNR